MFRRAWYGPSGGDGRAEINGKNAPIHRPWAKSHQHSPLCLRLNEGTVIPSMGLLPDTYNCAGNAGKVFPAADFKGNR